MTKIEDGIFTKKRFFIHLKTIIRMSDIKFFCFPALFLLNLNDCFYKLKRIF